MRKIKYLTPILGLTCVVGAAAPIATACSKAVESTKVLPYNLFKIDGVTLKGIVSGSDLTKYETIDIPEGVEHIAADAFNHPYVEKPDNAEEEATFDYSTIKTLKLPSTLKTVDVAAFNGLSNVSKIDLTSWTANTIQYVEFASGSLVESDFQDSRYCKIELPTGLTIDETNAVKEKLSKAGASDWWYIDQTTGHISATEGVSKEKTATCNADTTYDLDTGEKYQFGLPEDEVSLTLAETFDSSKYELYVYPQKTEATAPYDDVIVVNPHREVVDNKIATFTPISINSYDYVPDPEAEEPFTYWPMLYTEGHNINYDVNVVCKKISTGEVVWTEKVQGYKITNAYAHVTDLKWNVSETKEVEVMLSAIPSDVTEYISNTWILDPEWLEINEDACNKQVTFSSDDENVIFATDYDPAQGLDFLSFAGLLGKAANVTVASVDDPSKTDSISIKAAGARLIEGKDADNNPYLSSWYGHDYSELYKGSYGYVVPAGAVLKYSITLGEYTTNTGTTYTTDPCTAAYAPDTSDGKVRTFGQYQCIKKAAEYDPWEILPMKTANIFVTRSGSTERTPLLENTHYFIDAGRILLADNATDPDVKAAITFNKGDTLEFEIELNTTQTFAYSGFAFKHQKVA